MEHPIVALCSPLSESIRRLRLWGLSCVCHAIGKIEKPHKCIAQQCHSSCAFSAQLPQMGTLSIQQHFNNRKREGRKDIIKKGSKPVVRPFRKYIDAASILSLVWMLLWEHTFKLAVLFFYLCLFESYCNCFSLLATVESNQPIQLFSWIPGDLHQLLGLLSAGAKPSQQTQNSEVKKKISGINHVNSKCRFRISLWTERAVHVNRPTNQRGSDFIVCAITVNHEKLHLQTSSGAASNDTFQGL